MRRKWLENGLGYNVYFHYTLLLHVSFILPLSCTTLIENSLMKFRGYLPKRFLVKTTAFSLMLLKLHTISLDAAKAIEEASSYKYYNKARSSKVPSSF